MADQEFSSPGSHMASRSSSSSSSGSSVAYRNPNQSSSGSSAVIYAPSVDTGSSNARSYKESLYEANDYNRGGYANANSYNYNLYNNALSWYERMQNSSIQRMGEDMKKAGINPVLAGRYGGYNVAFPNVPYNNNYPYLDVSSLGSYETSTYASMISYINNNNNIDATSKNIAKQCMKDIEVANQYNQTSRDNVKLQTDTQSAINEATNKNNVHLQELVNQNKITIQEMENKQREFEAVLKAGTGIIDAIIPG